MRRGRLIPLAVGLLCFARPSGAQSRLTADVGASHLKQDGIPETSALTLGASADAAGDRASIHSSLLTTLAPLDRWTGQGVAVGSIVGPSLRPRWAFDGVASAFGETHDGPTFTGEAIGRALAGSRSLGGAIGGGVGGTTHAATSSPIYQGLADGWWSLADERLSISAALTSTHATFTDSSRFARTARPISYTDLAAGWQHDRGGLSLAASGGIRGQGSAFDRTDAWGAIDATAWVAPRTAIAASVGRTLADLVRGVPSTRYLSVAIRVSSRSHVTILSRGVDVAGPRLSIEPGAGGERRIDVRLRSAQRVELMADFTDWTPIELERDGDVWRLKREIPPGLHRVAIRIDGGAWTAPANLPRVNDDLGGVVGLVSVP
jgi:hypothetical protein